MDIPGLNRTISWPWMWSTLTAALLILCIYWPALSGPFVFDDLPNLAPVNAWLADEIDAATVLLGNESGPLGRPIAMLSFMTSAALGGSDPFGYKLFNLVLHLLNAGLIIVLVQRLLSVDGKFAGRTIYLPALAVATIWAIHPIQISTVAYVIQRMAQLATLFTLLALIAFAIASTAQLSSRSRRSLVFLVLPVATVLATLSKETGALVPGYCVALQLGWIGNNSRLSRAELKWFFSLFLVLPSLAAIALFAARPDIISAPYSMRDFSLLERLLTQPRVLFDYLGSYLAPHTTASVVHMDDVQRSTGLLSPVSTGFAIAGWILAAIVAFRFRRSVPALLGGLVFFLVGHALEATVFPLELAFEHRNYLASLAIPLTLATVLTRSNKLTDWWRSNRALGSTLLFAIVALLAGLTLLRAVEWSTRELLVQRSANIRPESLRAQLDLAQLAIDLGRFDLAMEVFGKLERSTDPRKQFTGASYAMFTRCLQGEALSPDWVSGFVAATPKPLTLLELTIAEALFHTVESGRCRGVQKVDLARAFEGMVSRQSQPGTDAPVWRIRYLAASAHALASRHNEARVLAARVWNDSGNFPWAGILLIKEAHQTGRYDEASETLRAVMDITPEGQRAIWRQLEYWSTRLDVATGSGAR